MAKPILETKGSVNRMFLFAGESGSGKSTAGASFARKGQYINVDFDKRRGGIIAAIEQGFFPADNIFVEEMDVMAGIDPWNSFCELHLARFRSGTLKVKTIQLSSLFSFSRMLKYASKQAFGGGRKVGSPKSSNQLILDGQNEFNTEISGTLAMIDSMGALPINFILDAHIIDKWGRVRYDDEGVPMDKFGEKITEPSKFEAEMRGTNEILGSKIMGRPEYIGGVVSNFGDVYVFSREMVGKKLRFFVSFSSDLAKNTWGLKPGLHDYTGVDFYTFFSKLTGWEGQSKT